MRRTVFVLAVVSLVPLATGCAHMGDKTKAGALLGAAIGAGTGAIIGHQTGHAGSGAAIGSGIGALTGGLIGNALDAADEEQEARLEEALHETGDGQVSILEIIRLSQAGVSDSVIIAKIDASRTVYDLDSQDIIDLKRSGVSERVIEHMLRRGSRHRVERRTVYRTAHHACPPVLPIHLGFGYHRVDWD